MENPFSQGFYKSHLKTCQFVELTENTIFPMGESPLDLAARQGPRHRDHSGRKDGVHS